MASTPARGDIWMVDLDPVRGHEQAGRRPALVVSADTFNRGAAGLVTVLPLTTRARGIPLHVTVTPPEGGLSSVSYIKCEDIRSISTERLITRRGSVAPRTMTEVEDRLRVLLDL